MTFDRIFKKAQRTLVQEKNLGVECRESSFMEIPSQIWATNKHYYTGA